MGMMDTLKSAIGMQPDKTPQKIDADGRNYTFVPGENGSLMAGLSKKPKPIYESKEPVAKVIGPKKIVQVGSSRG